MIIDDPHAVVFVGFVPALIEGPCDGFDGIDQVEWYDRSHMPGPSEKIPIISGNASW